MHDCISPEKVLAIGLYRLSHGNSCVSIGPTFNVGKSTIIEAVQDVVNALAPRENALDYFSRYQQHDFIIKAVGDGRGKFIDAVRGFPGSAHDA